MNGSIVLDEVRLEGAIIHEVHHARGCVLDDHSHEGATLGIVLDGSVTERRDGEVWVQHSGDVFVRRTGVRHANQYSPVGTRSLFIELEPDDVRVAALSRGDRLACDDLRRAGEQVARAFGSARSTDAGELRRSVNALLLAAAALRPRAAPAWLDVARDVLAARSRRPPKFEELAGQLRVHPVHFAQAFRARFRLAPGEFVRAHRVFNAVALAKQGVPLAEVADACGFADQSHMTRVVCATRGMPPGRLLRESSGGARDPGRLGSPS